MKISTTVDENIWREFKAFANQSRQKLSNLLTEAMLDFLQKKQVRPEFMRHMHASVAEHAKLGKLLAK